MTIEYTADERRWMARADQERRDRIATWQYGCGSTLAFALLRRVEWVLLYGGKH